MARWWQCKTCGTKLGEFGHEAIAHRLGTGHDQGNDLVVTNEKDEPLLPSSSSVGARAAAKEHVAEVIRQNKVRGGRR